jgi:hypothetical protein
MYYWMLFDNISIFAYTFMRKFGLNFFLLCYLSGFGIMVIFSNVVLGFGLRASCLLGKCSNT